MQAVTLAVRVNPSNPNHHLWNNNGTWFVHYTVYPDDVTATRHRQSLHTKCIREARQRRDQLFKNIQMMGGEHNVYS